MKTYFGITKSTGESWRECALRYAEAHGLGHEIVEAFDAYVASGAPEEEAAIDACLDWDVCELYPL